jgi:beta-lactamase superfamily II metal-dependent hydrolase
LGDLPPAVLIDNPMADRSIVHRRLRGEFERRGLRPRNLSLGENFAAAKSVSLQRLYPPSDFSRSTTANTDDQALVVRLTVGASMKVLFMSDSGYETEAALIESGVDLRSDILVKGQHHSGQSGSDAFLEAVRPRLIVATSRDFPAYQRVDEEWAEQVRSKNIKLFRQNETGAVELRFARDVWQARAYMTGEIFRSSSR